MCIPPCLDILVCSMKLQKEAQYAVNDDVIVTLCGIVSVQPYQPYILLYVHNLDVTAQIRQFIYISLVQTGESFRVV